MGNCAKYTSNPPKVSRQETVLPTDRFNEEPEDTPAFANKPLPSLDIRPLLRKVKVKNSPQKRIGVRFLVGGADEILLPEKAVDEVNAVKWELQENFQYFVTEYELRKKFLLIELLSGGVVLSTLKINMYLINIGPYHLDFEFPMNSQIKPRISFDFKMSQVVGMKIETEKLQVFQMKEYVGQQYAFSLKTIFGNNPKISELSNIYKVEHEQPEDNIPIAVWDGSVKQLPSISGSVPFYEFHYATLKYIFYKIDKISPNQSSEKPIAQCFISFVKLLGFDSSEQTMKDKIEYQVKHIKLQQKLWSGGKQCGKVKLNLKFEIQKHLKQMLVCVRTQHGILKMSPFYQTSANANSKQINKELTQLQQISQKLMNQQAELEKRRAKLRKDGQKMGSLTGLTKQSYKMIQKCLQSEVKLLEKSTKESTRIYQYRNDEQLLKGQNFLLKIGERQLRYINEGGEEVLEDLKWKVLRAVVERGEFTLSYMGFDLANSQNKDPTFLAHKKDLGLKFQDFYYRLLQLTLRTLGIKAANEQKKFAEVFCAIAYIRIPQFRERLLSLIDKPDDPEIEEWRGTDFSLKSKNVDFKTYLPGENTFEILFDWNKYFYEYLKNQPDYHTNIRELDNALKNREWQTRISKRRGAFFAFIRQWVAFVTKISVRIVHSNWKHFPGYIQIIKSLMSQMKMRQISQYPSSIKMACNSLLSNQNLLNTFITILFNKTNINNNFDVIKILELTNGFFHAIKKQNKRIPSTFNYRFFYNGIKLVIQNLYSYSTAKALHLLYEQFDFFSYDFKIQLCLYLLGRIFFKLFLHWSFNVRVIFHHLMIVKIYKFFTNQLKVDNLDPQTRLAIRNISSRYSELLIILQNLKKIKSKRFVPSTENQLYKKLRNNLRKKRKLQRKGEDQNTIQQQMLDQIPDTNLAQKNNEKAREETNKIMTQLARPQLERYDSQVISKDIKIALSETPIKQKDEVIRKKLTTFGNEGLISNVEIQEPDQAPKKKAPVAMNTAEQLVMPVLSQEDVKYVTPAMMQFNITSNGYLENIKKNKGDPSLKMEIMLDSSQMKPQQLNDVQQW